MVSCVSERPLVSFIVASYNYGRFIATTLQSVLDQTVQDLEVIVVDDASSDNSLAVIGSFADPRIRLHVNDENIGLVRTYNKGVSLSRGEYINFLDPDDWIEPRKIEEQLALFPPEPRRGHRRKLREFFDADGKPHPNAAEHEAIVNHPHDFNNVETWIGDNKLHACSVLMKRSAFDRIGPRDETMTTASDYEHWTRAHAYGCRFGIVQSALLCYRLHDENASAQDPIAPFLEMTYALKNSVLPAMEASSALHLIPRLLGWVIPRIQLGLLSEEQGCRLLALLARPEKSTDCDEFKSIVMSGGDPSLLSTGRRIYALYCFHPTQALYDRDIAWRDKEIAVRDREIASRDKDIAWRDREIAARATDIAWRDKEIAARATDIAWRDKEIALRDGFVAARDNYIGALEHENRALKAARDALQPANGQLLASTSWRLTKPLRAVGTRAAALGLALRQDRPARPYVAAIVTQSNVQPFDDAPALGQCLRRWANP